MIDLFLITTGAAQPALQPLDTKLIRAELNLAHSDNSFWVEFAVRESCQMEDFAHYLVFGEIWRTGGAVH